MFFTGENPDDRPQHRLESVLGFLRRELWHCGLLTNHQLQFRDQVSHQLAIGTQGFEDSSPPMSDFLLALAQDLMHERLESLRQQSIRHMRFSLLEFPATK